MITLYATCPPSSAFDGRGYLERIAAIAEWGEAHSFEGMLIYTDNSLLDPWSVAHALIANSTRMVPLIAIQPIYLHPYSVAKSITTFAHLYGRRIALNMVAGGFLKDLSRLGDSTPHDDRYVRLSEYTLIIRSLLEGRETSCSGRYYSVQETILQPPLPAGLFPEILVSGSSGAGLAAAGEIGAVPVCYPPPPEEVEATLGRQPGRRRGLRVGVIARPDRREAWEIAHARFPTDRYGQIVHKMALASSDSIWRRQLSEVSDRLAADQSSPYWLQPMQNYKTFCPYLVGSHEEVAAQIRRYLALGFEVFILDVPREAADLEHSAHVFAMAQAGQQAAPAGQGP